MAAEINTMSSSSGSPHPDTTGSDADEAYKLETTSIPSKRTGTARIFWSRDEPNKCHLLLYNLIMPFLVTATVATIAYYFDLPFVFPSLGPTAFLHFAKPNQPPSSPRNTLIGHFIGIIAGSAALQLTDLYDHENVFVEGMQFNRIFCAALSVSLTCCSMVILNVGHPPAGATTLIVSLGILKTPTQLAVMMAAVSILTIEAFIVNRIFRTDTIYPCWSVPKIKAEPRTNNVAKEKDFALLS